jgi:hypothetical protein
VGHDIYASVYTDGLETERFIFQKEQEVAYLRRGAYNPLAREIYAALNCQELDGGLSGAPGERTFARDELERALAYLRGRKGEGLDVAPEIAFIQACLSRLSRGAGELVIYFG